MLYEVSSDPEASLREGLSDTRNFYVRSINKGWRVFLPPPFVDTVYINAAINNLIGLYH